VSSAGLSFGCSGGRDVPKSGPLSGLRRRTTRICRHLGVRMISGMCPLARVQTSVGRIWQPVISHYSLGWVSCSPLCHSACSRDTCCTCQPPTWSLLLSSLLTFVWLYSPPRCICVLVLCLLCNLLTLCSPGNLGLHSLGCQCVPGPSGMLFQYRLREESSCAGLPTWLEVALAQAGGVLFVGWPYVNRWIQPSSSLRVSAYCLSS